MITPGLPAVAEIGAPSALPRGFQVGAHGDGVRIPLLVDGMRSSGDENERSDTSSESVSQASGGSGDLSDAELVHRLEDADREALGALYHRHGRPCYALARRVCSADGLAEQVVLEVFLTLWREPRRFDPGRGSVATWLLTLTHRRAVDTVRRLGVQRPPTEAPAAGRSAASQSAESSGAEGAAVGVASGAGLLTTEQREVLALAYFGGCTQREIAALTGIPLETVKSRLFAGIQRLRALLKDEEGRDAIAAEGRAIGEVNR